MTERAGTLPGAGAPRGLRRSLSLTHAVLYGLGVTIGAGIYALIGEAARRAGMHAPVSFVLTALLVTFTGASLAALAARMPVAAGEANYVAAGFGSRRMGTLVGLLVIAMALVSGATISVGAIGYIRVFLDLTPAMIVTAVVLSMGFVASRGVKESVAFAGIMTVIEVGGLLAVVAAGLWSAPGVVTRAPEMLPPLADAGAWAGIMSAALVSVFAYVGFEGIVNIAEETERPERTVPLALFITLILTTLLYVLVMWVALVSIGVERLSAAPAPLALVYEHLTGASPRTLALVAIVAILNGVVVNLILAARVMYGLARQGQLPALLGTLAPATATPRLATFLGAAITLALALALPIAALADITARLTLVVFAFVNLALALIKRRERGAPSRPHFDCPAWVPAAGFLSCLAFLAGDLLQLAAR
jgi:amino acid transporter